MALTINTNVSSLVAQRSLSNSTNALNKSMERLSTGLRINSAADDAAGLSISSRMTAQINASNSAMRNANDAISMSQVMDGTLNEGSNILQRMRELSVQALNGTNSEKDLETLDVEYQGLATDLGRLAKTKFNGIDMVGTKAGTFTFQIGPDAGDTLVMTTKDLSKYLEDAGDLTTAANAATATGKIDTALETLNNDRSTYGAASNRLSYVVSNLSVTSDNLSAARGRIMDADFATEAASMAKSQILQQAGAAMLAQANQMPSMVLNLLRG